MWSGVPAARHTAMTRLRPLARLVLSGSTLGLALSIALSILPSAARAYEDQLGLFATAGYTGIASDTVYPAHAVTLGAGIGVGLGDTWELRARADYAFHVAAMHRVALSADLVYVVDVLSVVPYLGLSVGGIVSVIDASLPSLEGVRGDLRLGAVLGLDLLLTRELAIGVELRPEWIVTDFDREPFELGAVLRLEGLFEL